MDQISLVDFEAEPFSYGSIIINKDRFYELLNDISNIQDQNNIREKIISLKNVINNSKIDNKGLVNIDRNGDTISLRRDVIISELDQIIKSKSTKRMKYYLERLIKGITEVRTSKINDINLNRWKEYDEIITDSLWILDKRDTSGAHLGWYWGNFIPQIPHQMILRYSKKDDWILDPFSGSGTTLIECRRLGRNGIGIELNPEVVKKSKKLISKEINRHNIKTNIIEGDSIKINIENIIEKYETDKFQLIIMHPPYFDIIKFSENNNDLSNAKDIDNFLEMFGSVVDNITPYLEKDRYLALVIGDKYHKGEWIPLGFYCMQEVLKREYKLKSIIVKNFEETRGKRNQKNLWRYRALVGGFYIFKHEYIFLFKRS